MSDSGDSGHSSDGEEVDVPDHLRPYYRAPRGRKPKDRQKLRERLLAAVDQAQRDYEADHGKAPKGQQPRKDAQPARPSPGPPKPESRKQKQDPGPSLPPQDAPDSKAKKNVVRTPRDPGQPSKAEPEAQDGQAAAKRTRIEQPRPQAAAAAAAAATGPFVTLAVRTGECVVRRLVDTAEQLGHSLVVLSATGLISKAMIGQLGPKKDRAAVTVQTAASFTLLSLSGCVLASAAGPARTSMAVSMASPTGGVIAGEVAGMLEAGGPVTLVVGHGVFGSL